MVEWKPARMAIGLGGLVLVLALVILRADKLILHVLTSIPVTKQNWPQVVSGFGTLGTLTVSVLILLRTQADKRSEQARKISAWVLEVRATRRENDYGVRIGAKDGKSVRLRARNGSDEPVYAFQAYVRNDYSPESGSHGSHEIALPPGEHDLWVDGVQISSDGLAGLPYVDICFRDAYGKRWQRLHDGTFGSDRLSRFGRYRGIRWQVKRYFALKTLKRQQRRDDRATQVPNQGTLNDGGHSAQQNSTPTS